MLRFGLAILLALPGEARASDVDARDVLERAQAHLLSAADACVAFSSFTTIASETEPLHETPWVYQGTWLFSNGRVRMDATSQVAQDGPPTETLYTFDGTVAKMLDRRGEQFDARVLADPFVFDPKYATLLIGGYLREAGGKMAFHRSVYEHLLVDADPQTLTATVDTDGQAAGLIRITGQMPWGDYEVWVDPARGYNMVRFFANI